MRECAAVSGEERWVGGWWLFMRRVKLKRGLHGAEDGIIRLCPARRSVSWDGGAEEVLLRNE